MHDRIGGMFLLLLVIAILATTASVAPAQVLTRPAKQADEIVEIIADGVLPGTTLLVFTVSPDKHLFITDLLLSTRGGSCSFAILRNGTRATSTLCSSCGCTSSSRHQAPGGTSGPIVVHSIRSITER